MAKEPNFATEREKLAREIQLEINIGKIHGQNLHSGVLQAAIPVRGGLLAWTYFGKQAPKLTRCCTS
ncbi:MAG: hypothetical protein PUP93_07610 [Rhizonema sp. NSF051]|nr:hypothetical protein [Rhizonema sp. NSF051]